MATPNPSTDTALLTPEEAKLRAELYLKQRIEHQRKFYQNRVREFQFNSSAMLVASAILMFLTSIVSAVSASQQSAGLALCSAIIPAFAALIAAFRSLYQWERQAMLYEDVQFSLDEALLELPDSDYPEPTPASEYVTALPRLVDKGEQAFQNEAAQWGQIQIATLQRPGEAADLDDENEA